MPLLQRWGRACFTFGAVSRARSNVIPALTGSLFQTRTRVFVSCLCEDTQATGQIRMRRVQKGCFQLNGISQMQVYRGNFVNSIPITVNP